MLEREREMQEAAEGLKQALQRIGTERDLLERTRDAQEDAATEWRLFHIAMGYYCAVDRRCKVGRPLKRCGHI